MVAGARCAHRDGGRGGVGALQRERGELPAPTVVAAHDARAAVAQAGVRHVPTHEDLEAAVLEGVEDEDDGRPVAPPDANAFDVINMLGGMSLRKLLASSGTDDTSMCAAPALLPRTRARGARTHTLARSAPQLIKYGTAKDVVAALRRAVDALGAKVTVATDGELAVSGGGAANRARACVVMARESACARPCGNTTAMCMLCGRSCRLKFRRPRGTWGLRRACFSSRTSCSWWRSIVARCACFFLLLLLVVVVCLWLCLCVSVCAPAHVCV